MTLSSEEVKALVERLLGSALELVDWHFNRAVYEREGPEFDDVDDLFMALRERVEATTSALTVLVRERDEMREALERVMKRENRFRNAMMNADEKLVQNHDNIADMRAEIRSAHVLLSTALNGGGE